MLDDRFNIIQMLLMIGGIESNPGPESVQGQEMQDNMDVDEINYVELHESTNREQLVARHWEGYPQNTKNSFKKGFQEFEVNYKL